MFKPARQLYILPSNGVRLLSFRNFNVRTIRQLSEIRYYSSSPGIGQRRKPLTKAQPENSDGPVPRAMLSAEESQRIPQGNLSDYNLYSELEPPANNVDSVTDNGFLLSTGGKIESTDPNHPTGLILLGTEAFQVDMSGAFTGLDTGIVEISKQIIGIFEVAHPKPEILVVGLGGKSRILGPKTSEYFRSLGMRLQISNTVSSICEGVNVGSILGAY
ncbi:Uncharacterized protein C3orf60-like protein [Sugiyamaella lignohabitans]|uniref:Uncharacterized protein C3orf60-like protein n=1 Tax=Sugiyamaella lignohabitans TaxID=796027 RepID=A0A161HL06_9ASCO|nr:Uncharacterized protein C3orf60-like protein [Sugiyamaella lignohabitans]ANB12618.1 Uncharacterized protein C3orf60-like protein [Sugiyamaella lignohabitans]